MRESIGTTWIMMIVVAFITLFSGYLAFSVNYSKAFRLKDGIVQRLEKHSGPNAESISDIEALIDEIGYNSLGRCVGAPVGDASENVIGVREGYVDTNPYTDDEYSYCISKVTSYNPSGQLTAAYYKVAVFFSISIPLMRLDSIFFINGETININYPKDDYMISY